MARQAGLKVINKFQRGLVTEGTGLNFPEDAVTEAYNVKFEPEGIAKRRLGFDWEADAAYSTPLAGFTDETFTEYYWRNAAGNANYNFVVVQIGRYLYFYKTSASSLSGGIMASTVDIMSHKSLSTVTEDQVEAYPCQYASGNGYLFVTHPFCDPFFIEYTASSETFSTTEIDIKIRDFEGVDDTLDIDERPATLSAKHNYNLVNQGWHQQTKIVEDGEEVDVIDDFFDKTDTYPSNADIWWLFKNAEGYFRPRLYSSQLALGNTQAPKGHYILRAFYQDRSGESGVAGISVTSAGIWRPTSVAFFAGRVWYAGVNNARFSSSIYFSQIAENDDQYGLCYQMNDPTSENAADLLPTDGGVIKILDIGTVYKMIPIQSSMLVFASNGVWAISGSEGLGFRANDYSVRKVSSVGAISSTSFVDVEGFAMWWNQNGIYGVATDNLGQFSVQSITDNTIKSFFDDIPLKSKLYAKSTYNTLTRTIQWIYRSTEESSSSVRYHYDRILNYNMLTQAFFPYTISTGMYVGGIITIEGQGTVEAEDQVISSVSDTVVSAALDNVVITSETERNLSAVTKYLTWRTDTSDYSWAEESSNEYRDWLTDTNDPDDSNPGKRYSSYFITGYNLDGQAVNHFQSNYVLTYCNEVEGSGVYMQGIWDWATTNSTGKWSTPQQAYNNNISNLGVRVSKLKNRGNGRSLQLKYYSYGDRPFSIIGWSFLVSSNQVP